MKYVDCVAICVDEKDSEKAMEILKENGIKVKDANNDAPFYVNYTIIKQEVEYRVNEMYKEEIKEYCKNNDTNSESIIENLTESINEEDEVFESLTSIIDEVLENLLKEDKED